MCQATVWTGNSSSLCSAWAQRMVAVRAPCHLLVDQLIQCTQLRRMQLVLDARRPTDAAQSDARTDTDR